MLKKFLRLIVPLLLHKRRKRLKKKKREWVTLSCARGLIETRLDALSHKVSPNDSAEKKY
jgi:hypothetical protein